MSLFKGRKEPDTEGWKVERGGNLKTRIAPDRNCPECEREVTEIWAKYTGTAILTGSE